MSQQTNPPSPQVLIDEAFHDFLRKVLCPKCHTPISTHEYFRRESSEAEPTEKVICVRRP